MFHESILIIAAFVFQVIWTVVFSFQIWQYCKAISAFKSNKCFFALEDDVSSDIVKLVGLVRAQNPGHNTSVTSAGFVQGIAEILSHSCKKKHEIYGTYKKHTLLQTSSLSI